MNKNALLLLISVAILLVACDPKQKDEILDNEPLVSKFVYEGLSTYYLWADEMVSKNPTAADEKDPEAYFQTLLNPLDISNGWSWITDDVDALLADFSGNPKDFGWSLALYRISNTNNVEGYVKYVFPNTPASSASIVRGDVIHQVDGVTMNLDNYTKLFDGNALSVGVGDPKTGTSRTVNLTPVTIQTNPILVDTVYRDRPEFNGKKIGYLFYTDFIGGYNGKLQETFSDFKQQGVTDLVVDLRNNHGGGIDAANYLASLIAPRTAVEQNKPFTKLQYNSFLNSLVGEGGRTDSLGVVGGISPLTANLNLNKVYIIATDDSYSAAELLTFCLRPYMDVVHIGSRTGGKFTASFTITPYDDKGNKAVTLYEAKDLTSGQREKLKTWAMQPIVAKYSNGLNQDFESPGYLVPNVPVTLIEDPKLWKMIGDKNDYLLAKAISLITGLPVPAAAQSTSPRSVYSIKGTRLYSPTDKILKESVQIDLPTPARREILRRLNN